MGKNISPEIENRLQSDIENYDQLTLLAANILYDLEAEIMSGNFNPDQFKHDIEKKYRLDETRKLLLGKAMDVYKAAIEYTEQDEGILADFLKTTKL